MTVIRPGKMDVLGVAKFDAWAALKGLVCEQAIVGRLREVGGVLQGLGRRNRLK